MHADDPGVSGCYWGYHFLRWNVCTRYTVFRLVCHLQHPGCFNGGRAGQEQTVFGC